MPLSGTVQLEEGVSTEGRGGGGGERRWIAELRSLGRARNEQRY